MRDENFDLPVTIVTETSGHKLTVTRTAQAAVILLNRWPEAHRGREYRSALKAMMDAMEQRRDVSVARKAFAVAAKEANVLVKDGRRAN